MLYLLAGLAILGHWTLCVYTINRVHATALPPWFVKGIDLIWYGFLFFLPALVAYWVVARTPSWWLNSSTVQAATYAYAVICWASLLAMMPAWFRHLTQSAITTRLESNHTTAIDVVRELGHEPSGSFSTRLFAKLPANQVFDLRLQEKDIRLPRLPACLDGLTIAHLSDLHFTGRISRSYYDLIVEKTNALHADIVVISGDIIDKKKCFGWIAEVLGKLQSRSGVFCVLGNHDLRIRDEGLLRQELVRNGMVDLGGRFEVRELRGYPVVLAGNELPWFAPAADMRQVPDDHPQGRPFRIVVSHSPDQYPWARRNDVDLLLAGHTHGGQIRLPWIGPIFAPSYFGVRYASGTFYEEPTLMHVSRGLAGTRPLRYNCPPELARLRLRAEGASR